jgi:hypothetical protein
LGGIALRFQQHVRARPAQGIGQSVAELHRRIRGLFVNLLKLGNPLTTAAKDNGLPASLRSTVVPGPGAKPQDLLARRKCTGSLWPASHWHKRDLEGLCVLATGSIAKKDVSLYMLQSCTNSDRTGMMARIFQWAG